MARKKKNMGNMKYRVANDSIAVFLGSNTELSCGLMTAVANAIGKIRNLPEWEFILEDVLTSKAEAHYRMHLVSSKGKGTSCAAAKLFTLQNHPEIGNTGELKQSSVLGKEEVSWYGGIQIPYTGYETDENGETIPCSGIVRIVFSGAREGVDLGIVLDALSALKKNCAVLIKDATYAFDEERLHEDQFVDYIMRLKDEA